MGLPAEPASTGHRPATRQHIGVRPMVTESVSESTYRPNYFPLPPSLISSERDEVLDNLVGVLNTTLTHPDEAVQLIARKALDEVRRVQEQARRKLADQQAGLSA